MDAEEKKNPETLCIMFSAKERTAAVRPDNLRPPYHVAKLDVLFKSVPAVCCLAVEIFPVQFNHLAPKKRPEKQTC